MKLYIFRHGKTLMNELGKAQGWVDSDLTELGKKELHELYSTMSFPIFDSVYSSDLGRSIKTLEVLKQYITIKNSTNIFYLKGLRERFLGSFEGEYLENIKLFVSQEKGYKNYLDYQKYNSFSKYINHNRELDPKKYAEDFTMLKERVEKSLKRIIDDSIKNNWDNVLIVGHQNSIGLIQSLLLNELEIFDRINLDNGQYLIFSYEQKNWRKIDND